MSNFAQGRPGGPYRARNGAFLGVCHGLANYFDWPVHVVQLGFCVAAGFTGVWPTAVAYVILALLMKPEPVLPFQNTGEAEFYHSYTSSRGMALQRLKQTMDNLDRRLQRIENIVTTRGYDWDRRFNGSGGK